MRRPSVAVWVDERSPAVVVTVLLAVGALVYWSIFVSFGAQHGWKPVSDLWNSAGVGLAIGHGHWSAVYASPSQLESPPGLEFVLAPLMVVGHALGLSSSAAQGHAYTVWLLLLPPVATFMAASVLFALDAIARHWGYFNAKRLALSAAAGVAVVSAAAFWGHPEDCIALAFVLWAALAMDRNGSSALTRAGWLLGFAVAFQPLALLAVAPIVARFGLRDLCRVAWRLALPTLVLVLPELLSSQAHTLHVLIDQPVDPWGLSATPFSHLSRALGHGMYSGGTLRMVSTLIAVVLGFAVCRRRHDLPTVLFVMALAFTLRVLLADELLGLYFFPVLALTLLLSLRRKPVLFGWCAAASLLCLILGNRKVHGDIALWWPAIMMTTVFMVGLAYWAVFRAAEPAAAVKAGTREGPHMPRTTLSDATGYHAIPSEPQVTSTPSH
jgi:hypothetical protein